MTQLTLQLCEEVSTSELTLYLQIGTVTLEQGWLPESMGPAGTLKPKKEVKEEAKDDIIVLGVGMLRVWVGKLGEEVMCTLLGAQQPPSPQHPWLPAGHQSGPAGLSGTCPPNQDHHNCPYFDDLY